MKEKVHNIKRGGGSEKEIEQRKRESDVREEKE